MTCQTCSEADRRGYCAPLRCYCGHRSCHAFASWVDLKSIDPTAAVPSAKSRAAKSWANREESTWLDKL